MAESDPSIDPRYRSEFQRGGAPAPVGRSSARPDAVRQESARQDAPRRPATPGIGLPPRVAAPSVASPSAPVGPSVTAPEASGAFPAEAAEPVAEQGRNPFVVAAWIVSIAAAVFPFGLLYWSASDQSYYSGNGSAMPVELIVRQVIWSGGPPMITAGVLGVIGLLLWHARNRQQRRTAARRD